MRAILIDFLTYEREMAAAFSPYTLTHVVADTSIRARMSHAYNEMGLLVMENDSYLNSSHLKIEFDEKRKCASFHSFICPRSLSVSLSASLLLRRFSAAASCFNVAGLVRAATAGNLRKC